MDPLDHLKVTVDEVKGFCDLPMEKGDHFWVKGGRIVTPPNQDICLWALQSMMPFLPAKQRNSNEENDWIPETKQLVCPDPNGRVIFKIERIVPASGETVTTSSEQTPSPRILVDSTTCTGCRACETVCSLYHEGVGQGLSRIKVTKDEPAGKDQPLVCRQCGDAPCVKVCPTSALTKDFETGAVLIEEENCPGCKSCLDACPFEGIFTAPDRSAPLVW